MLSCLLLCVQSGTPEHGMVPPTVPTHLPSKLTQSRNPLTGQEVCFQSDSSLVKLRVKINHCSRCDSPLVGLLRYRVLPPRTVTGLQSQWFASPSPQEHVTMSRAMLAEIGVPLTIPCIDIRVQDSLSTKNCLVQCVSGASVTSCLNTCWLYFKLWSVVAISSFLWKRLWEFSPVSI